MNDKKKYAKILIVFLITCIIGLSNFYYILYCNDKKANLSEEQINDIAFRWPWQKATTKATTKAATKATTKATTKAINSTRKKATGPAEGSLAAEIAKDAQAKKNKEETGSYTTKPKTTTTKKGNSSNNKKGGNINVSNTDNNNFETVHINGISSTWDGKQDQTCDGTGKCSSVSYNPNSTNKNYNATLSTETVDKSVPDAYIGWVINGKLSTDKFGRTITVDVNQNTKAYPCIMGKTCPKTTNNTPTGGSPTKKTNGVKKADNYPNKVNKEVWATDGEYSGSSIKCGDKLYITACNNDNDPICKVTKINGKSVSNTFIRKSHYVENEADTGCYQNATRYVQKDSYYYSDSDLSKDKKTFPCGDQVTLKKTIEVACNDKSCEVEYNGKTIYLPKDALITYKPTCSSDPTGTCNSSEKQTNVTGNITIKICNKDDNIENRDKFVTCAPDYKKTYKLVNDQCGENPTSSCYREYEYTCTFGKSPGISASAGIINSNGIGTINITGYDYGNVGLKGYYLSAGNYPTETSEWKQFDNNNKAVENQRAGTYFIWAMNNKNIMSNSVLVKVYDADLSTTLSTFHAIDGNGDIVQMNQLDNKVANADQIIDAKYALLSNKLLADADGTGFDKLTTSYEITTTSNKIALYATLTNEDADYFDGLGPRTAYLDYGVNSLVIGIYTKDGKERYYSFIVNRVDDRDNDNKLKSIKLSKGKIDFDPYVTNYDVEISKNTKKVSINAELNSEYAYFVEGYEPRTIDITEDRQSALIKVMSDAENIRTYVITFTRKNYVEEPTSSAYLSSLTVPGTQFAFDRETYEYTITVPYEMNRVPIYAFAESENAIVDISDSNDLNVGNNLVEITVTNGKNSKIYNLNIIRKQEGLDVSDSTRLGMLSIKDYDINFDPNILDYTVKIKREKTLMIAATPESNRADIYMYGNNDLTGFSTVRIKVIAENGATEIYSIDIKKDAYNKKLEIIVASVGCLVIIISGIIIISKRKKNNKKEYMEG